MLYCIGGLRSQASANGRFAKVHSNSLIGNCATANISAFVTMSTQTRISYQVSAELAESAERV